MITLHFEHGPMNQAVLGPSPSFRILGNFIRDSAGAVVARYERHFWHVHEMSFTSYKCPHPLQIHFEDLEGGHSRHYGPFKSAFVADGSVYVEDRLFCKFMDTTLLWHDHEGDTFWPTMVLTGAG